MSANNYHLGHLMLDCFTANPEGICQIDAATGESETNASVLARVERLSRCFHKLGLQPGDVLALGGRNHLDLHIPYYAALMCGLPVAAMDPLYKYDEILSMFKITEPKIAFCQSETYEHIHQAVEILGLDTLIVQFDSDCDLNKFIETNDQAACGEEFRPTDFDSSKVFAWLTPTSGTTGVQKFAAFTHQQLIRTLMGFKAMSQKGDMDRSGTNSLNLSPVQWISAYFNAVIFPIIGSTKVQTSAAVTPDHLVDILNKYKPVQMMITPWTATDILNHPSCDMTCFRHLTLTGSKVPKEVLLALRARTDPTKCRVVEMYGQTETLGPCLTAAPEGPLGNCGKPYPPGFVQIQLVDPETDKVITEPHKPGEMWVKGYSFTEYYGMPEETAKAFSPDGWYKTGDLLYRDENNFYYFYERMKMLIKYKNYHIPPMELEEVIATHPAVAQVAVSSIEDSSCGELPVACVVVRPGAAVTAEEIQQLVASKLSESKHLRGGVVFLDALPATSTGKIARGKLRKLVEGLK